jgi:predicted metal-dependent phosphoesterase TrpH
MKFDLHMHTTRHSPDSQMEPSSLVKRAVELGLDGVVITEHDWLWTEEELDELRREAPRLVILAGIEVTCREGHFLTYGVTDPFALKHGIRVADLCREVHRQGGAVVAAHPFRWGQRFDEILQKERPELDGLELRTSNMDEDCRCRAAEMQRVHHLAGLGSSDAHDENVLGYCYTEFAETVRDRGELVAAIRSRRATAHDGPPSRR